MTAPEQQPASKGWRDLTEEDLAGFARSRRELDKIHAFIKGEPSELKGRWMTEDEINNHGRSGFWWGWAIMAFSLGGFFALAALWIMQGN